MRIKLMDKTQKACIIMEEKQKIGELLFEFQDLWQNQHRGVTNKTSHKIALTTTKLLAMRPRRFTEEQQSIIEKKLKEIEKRA